MHICSCRPVGDPLTTSGVVKHIAEGASTVKDVITRSGATTGCGGCAGTLAKGHDAVAATARQRDQAAGRAGPAWPTSDEFARADSDIARALLR